MILAWVLGCGVDATPTPTPPPVVVVDERPSPWADPALGFSSAVVQQLDALERGIAFARRSDADLCRAIDAAEAAAPALNALLAGAPAPALRARLRAVEAATPGLRWEIPADEAPPGPARVTPAWNELARAAAPAHSGALISWSAWTTASPPWASGPCVDPTQLEPWVVRLTGDPAPPCVADHFAEAAARRFAALTDACWCGDEAAARIGVARIASLSARISAFAEGARALQAQHADATHRFTRCAPPPTP